MFRNDTRYTWERETVLTANRFSRYFTFDMNPPHRANDQLNVYRQMSPRFQTFQRRYRVWLVRCTVLHVEALQFQIPTEKENVALNCGYLRPIR